MSPILKERQLQTGLYERYKLAPEIKANPGNQKGYKELTTVPKQF